MYVLLFDPHAILGSKLSWLPGPYIHKLPCSSPGPSRLSKVERLTADARANEARHRPPLQAAFMEDALDRAPHSPSRASGNQGARLQARDFSSFRVLQSRDPLFTVLPRTLRAPLWLPGVLTVLD